MQNNRIRKRGIKKKPAGKNSERKQSTEHVETKLNYRPLDTDVNEIRLLTLLPQDNASDTISCLLEHVSLVNPQDYDALSYCWGDLTITAGITINGIRVEVTSNLESALRHLRSKGYRRLWVDALCINQHDKAEQSQQLLWMGSIYRRASTVAAWTGEDSQDSERALSALHKRHEYDAAYLKDLVSFLAPENYQMPMRSPRKSYQYDRDDLKALKSFLGRPYWRRVWVIQELALARHTVVHCGNHEVFWIELRSGIELHLLGDFGSASEFINARNLAKFQIDAVENKPLRFLDALKRNSMSLATDPRDKAFALLGLVYDGGLYIPVPNYKQSIRDICVGITLSAIFTTLSLDVVTILAPHSARGDVPSWSPNWFFLNPDSAPRQVDRILQYAGKQHYFFKDSWRRNSYQAAGDTQPNVSMDGDCLKVKASFLGQIIGLCPLRHEVGDIPVITTSLSTSGTSPYGGEKEVMAAIDSSLIRNSVPKSNRCAGGIEVRPGATQPCLGLHLDLLPICLERQEEGPRLLSHSTTTDATKWLRAVNSFKVQGLTLEEWAARSKHECAPTRYISPQTELSMQKLEQSLEQGMRFMTTDIGYIGWTSHQAQVGDKICLLQGSSVPITLRTRTDGSYVVVGDAYVQGLMHGERAKVLGRDDWVDIEIY